MIVRRKIGHRETAHFAILSENPGHGGRNNATRHAHPFDFEMVALERRLPVRGHSESRQSAFDAEGSTRQIGTVNVR